MKQDGSIYVGEDLVDYADLADRLKTAAGDNLDQPVYLRADGRASYETVAKVMAKLSVSGFAKIDMVTDTAAPEPRR